MQWFRFYNEVVNDPKVQCLSAETFKVWVNVLCLTSQNDGKIPSEHDLAFSLRLPFQSVSDHMEILYAAGLIDDKNGHKTPHNWQKRQFKSDTSTDRVKRFRNGQRNNKETPSETVSSVSVSTSVSSRKGDARGKPSKPDAVSDQTWQDFKTHRKAKRAPVTQAALDGINSEAIKAGITLEDALKEMCARGWQGFKAEWMKNDANTGTNISGYGKTNPGNTGPSKGRQFLDAGEAIIAKRNAARATQEHNQGQSEGSRPTDTLALPNLCNVEKIR
jgi:hypothetical protein